MKKIIYSGTWKLEKTFFERYQKNTAKGSELPHKKYTVFIFKRQGYFFLNKKVRVLANGDRSPLPGPSLRMQVFFGLP